MPFAFILLGALFTISGVRGKSNDLFTLFKGEFTGENNFLYWLVSILLIGSLGYIPAMRPLSRAFLVLVLVVLVLKEGNPNSSGGGFFSQFTDSLKQISKG